MTMTEGLLFCVDKAQGVRCRPEGDGVYLLYSAETDELHLVGKVEKAIFDLCDGRPIDQVVAAAEPMLRRMGVMEQDQAAVETMEFLRAMQKRALIVFR